MTQSPVSRAFPCRPPRARRRSSFSPPSPSSAASSGRRLAAVSDATSAGIKEYADILATARAWYADDVARDKLVYASIHGMLTSPRPAHELPRARGVRLDAGEAARVLLRPRDHHLEAEREGHGHHAASKARPPTGSGSARATSSTGSRGSRSTTSPSTRSSRSSRAPRGRRSGSRSCGPASPSPSR